MLDRAIADFAIPATGNALFRLAEQRGKTVILYFYPKDSTPGCTTEAQQFRDLHAQFVDAGCVIDAARHNLNLHETLRAAQTQDPDFTGRFRDYAQTYRLPEGE